MALIGNDFRCDTEFLTETLERLLRMRYVGKRDLDVVELGPRATTLVPYTLQHHMRHYLGIDYSPSCVAKQAELLKFQKIPRSSARLGNTYWLELEDASQDLVIASCHDPLYSGSPTHLSQSFGEVHRILRERGELILVPWHEANYGGKSPPYGCATFTPLEVAAAAFQFFRIEKMVYHPDRCAPPSFALVLRKHRSPVNQLDQHDFYEEAEVIGRRVVDEWLETSGDDNPLQRQAIAIWKTHRLERTRLYAGGRTRVSSWNESIRATSA